VATIKERLDKHDRQIAAIRDLLQAGMRMLAENQRVGLEMKALAAAQKRTDETLQSFINSLRRGGNGHGKSERLR